jgi:2'-hydroxyisoflavone reductase
MKLLVLGGTVFVGRHIVAEALGRGHAVAMFNRGREDDGSCPEVERLIGDRGGDLAALRGRAWDAVVDVSAYVPSFVENVGRALAGACGHYTYVSTRSVYAELGRTREEDALAEISDAEVAAAESLTLEGRTGAALYGPSYGALKVRCERAAAQAFGDRLLIVRPGLIVGPHDHSDRFTYWVRRVARGGDLLAPGRPQRTVRFIDARDLAAWIIRSIERRLTGVFNTGGVGTTMQGVLEACREASRSDARLHWAEESFLLERGVSPWSELPLWIPEEQNVFLEVGDDRAMREGLDYRAILATTRDTLAWDRTRPPGPMKAGLTEAREAELLADLARA